MIIVEFPRRKKKSRVFLLQEPAVGTGIEDCVPLTGWAHLSGVLGHSFVSTSRAAPLNHGSLELEPFLHWHRHGCPQFVEHDTGVHDLPLKVLHGDTEATANTGDRVLCPRQWQEGATIRTQVQVRLEPGAGLCVVHDVPGAEAPKAAPLLDWASGPSSSPPPCTHGAHCPDLLA